MSERRSEDATRPESLTIVLTRVTRALAADLDALLKPEGLSADHWLVLEALTRERGLTMTELTERTGSNSATLTRIVDRLVSNAVAYREVDAEDRRKVRVYVGSRGRSLYRKLSGRIDEREQALINDMSLLPALVSRELPVKV